MIVGFDDGVVLLGHRRDGRRVSYLVGTGDPRSSSQSPTIGCERSTGEHACWPAAKSVQTPVRACGPRGHFPSEQSPRGRPADRCDRYQTTSTDQVGSHLTASFAHNRVKVRPLDAAAQRGATPIVGPQSFAVYSYRRTATTVAGLAFSHSSSSHGRIRYSANLPLMGRTIPGIPLRFRELWLHADAGSVRGDETHDAGIRWLNSGRRHLLRPRSQGRGPRSPPSRFGHSQP